MNRPFIAFHFGLVQDVAVLRPLVRLAAGTASRDIKLLVADSFAELDAGGMWTAEIAKLGSEIGVEPLTYGNGFDVLRHLGPGAGLIIAGSESNVRAHVKAHELFRAMPGRIRSITLQHGFECVGFLHNQRHDATAGRNVRFAADIAVGWFPTDRLHAVAAGERSKIFVAGPPSLIEKPGKFRAAAGPSSGLVCENLHSVRFASGQVRETFLDAFTSFADRLAMVGQRLALRPHPAGRFTTRSGKAVPSNVDVQDSPIYELDLRAFEYAISAPSTVLFDFALAGVPVATWVDTDGAIDARNFAGLAQVATVDDWWRFSWASRWQRQALLDRQAAFIDGLGIPKDVPGRYQQLLAAA